LTVGTTTTADADALANFDRLAEGAPFAFTRLWTSRSDDETDELVRAARSSRPARTTWSPVHDRMPVILPTSLEGEWLDPDVSREHSREHALSLLQPLAPTLMTARPASRLVNSVRNDVPELLAVEDLAA
jgi:putative SOS response-associated peptidase YedK